MSSIFKHQLETSIRINASPESVWTILSDLKQWETWNPFMVKASGILKEGSTLSLTFQAPGMSPMNIQPVVQRYEPAKGFSWLGSLGIRGIFDGEHSFELQADGNSTMLFHREKFSGVLIPFMKKILNVNTRQGFELMNEALKKKAEATNP